jgi:HAD superfamily hydrolase (TIGR01459 family)
MTEVAPGLRALAPLYDGFILDQWGVLHDGVRPYPGAVECLGRLHAAGKRIIVVSNSGRRSAPNVAIMARLGFPPALYDTLISAGEDAWLGLRNRADPFYAGLGRRALVIARDDHGVLLEGLDVERAERAEDADFVLLLGIDRDLEAYEAAIATALARGLKLICANPDLVRFSDEGMKDAAGALARRYEARGGEVRWHGKPHPPIYRTALASLGIADRARILAIGDSVEHDIAGAAAIGIDAALVACGIHTDALGWPADAAALARLCADAGAAMPRWILRDFSWSS